METVHMFSIYFFAYVNNNEKLVSFCLPVIISVTLVWIRKGKKVKMHKLCHSSHKMFSKIQWPFIWASHVELGLFYTSFFLSLYSKISLGVMVSKFVPGNIFKFALPDPNLGYPGTRPSPTGQIYKKFWTPKLKPILIAFGIFFFFFSQIRERAFKYGNTDFFF